MQLSRSRQHQCWKSAIPVEPSSLSAPNRNGNWGRFRASSHAFHFHFQDPSLDPD